MGKIKKGLVHIYTGEGKGKTLTAIGLGMRAHGWNEKVCMFQFLKEKKHPCGELKFAKQNLPKFKIVRFDQKHPMFEKKAILEHKTIEKQYNKLRKSISDGLAKAREVMDSGKYNVIILDEILNCASQKFLDEEVLIDFIKNKPKSVELVLTGRGVTPRLIKLADYVTIMGKIKHPYDKGIKARKGIEY